MGEFVEATELARPASRQRRKSLAGFDRLAPRLEHLWDVARRVGVGAHLIDVPGAVVATAESAHERSRDHDLGLLPPDELATAGYCIALGVVGHRRAHPRAMLQIVIRIDVDDLVERAELGVPEAAQRRVSQAGRQPLFVALLEFGHGSGAQGVGANFVDHWHILPSERVCRARERSALSRLPITRLVLVPLLWPVSGRSAASRS